MTGQTTRQQGLLFALVGPSAAGKNTLMQGALQHFADLRQLPTATTRPMREGEQAGREHLFVSDEEFQALIRREALIEWQIVHGKRYGVPRQTVEEAIQARSDLIADIEVLGASVLRREYPQNTVLIFVTSPDPDTLEQRIRERGGADEAEIEMRLQRAKFEMGFVPQSDYLIINHDVEQATQELISIIQAERCRRSLADLTISVLIRNDDQVLAGDGDVRQRFALPSTPVFPEEHVSEAARRLVQAMGLGEVAFQTYVQPEADEGQIVPAHFRLASTEGVEHLDLVVAGELVGSARPPLPGWRWLPISEVPLAQAVFKFQADPLAVP